MTEEVFRQKLAAAMRAQFKDADQAAARFWPKEPTYRRLRGVDAAKLEDILMAGFQQVAQALIDGFCANNPAKFTQMLATATDARIDYLAQRVVLKTWPAESPSDN